MKKLIAAILVSIAVPAMSQLNQDIYYPRCKQVLREASRIADEYCKAQYGVRSEMYQRCLAAAVKVVYDELRQCQAEEAAKRL